MVDVARIYTNTSGVSTSFNRAGVFDSAVYKQGGQWRGAKQENSSGGLWASNLPNKTAGEKTAQAEQEKQKSNNQNLSRFYAKDSSYSVDYRAKDWLARAPRDTKKSSSSWTPLFA